MNIITSVDRNTRARVVRWMLTHNRKSKGKIRDTIRSIYNANRLCKRNTSRSSYINISDAKFTI